MMTTETKYYLNFPNIVIICYQSCKLHNLKLAQEPWLGIGIGRLPQVASSLPFISCHSPSTAVNCDTN